MTVHTSYEQNFKQPLYLKWYWAFPSLVFCYAMLGSPNTEGFVWWTLLAAVACGLPVLCTGYSALSFVSLIGMLHAMYYPLAVLLNLMASSPGVYEKRLWEQTPSALIAVSVGMCGLALGAVFVNIVALKGGLWRRQIRLDAFAQLSRVKLMLLVLLIIPYTLFKIYTNTYFHLFAADPETWSESNALRWGFVGYLEAVIYAGVFLFWLRYFATKLRRDVLWTVVASLIPFLITLPSGSREQAIRPLLSLLFVASLQFSARFTLRRCLVVISGFFAFFLFTVAIQSYRSQIVTGVESRDLSFMGRLNLIGSSITGTIDSFGESYDLQLQVLARRLADYPVVGEIIYQYPRSVPFRGFSDLGYWPVYVLPIIVRPSTPDFDPRQSAALCAEVGVAPANGSCPAMIIGDLFSRFSWLGIFFGMAVIGALFRILDFWLAPFGLRHAILYALLLPMISKLPQFALFEYFMFLTRNLLILYLISRLLTWFLTSRRAHKTQMTPSLASPTRAPVYSLPGSRAVD